MGKDACIGINGIAKKIKAMYVGVNGVAKKIKKAYVGVNGVAKEWMSGDHGYLFVKSGSSFYWTQECDVYHTDDFITYTPGTTLHLGEYETTDDIHHIHYNTDRNRWEVLMNVKYSDLPDSYGYVYLKRKCYYNTDPKAQGTWQSETVYLDHSSNMQWRIYVTSGGDDYYYLNIDGWIDGTRVDLSNYRIYFPNTPSRVEGIPAIDFINIGDDILLSMSVQYMYRESGDPKFDSVPILANCSANSERSWIQNAGRSLRVYQLDYKPRDFEFMGFDGDITGGYTYAMYYSTSTHQYEIAETYSGKRGTFFSDDHDLYINSYQNGLEKYLYNSWIGVDNSYGICGH